MNRGFGNVVGGDGRSGWWDRRQAHEAAIHRWDVHDAVAKADPIESNLALDGVGEFFEVALDVWYATRITASTAGSVL